MSDGERLGGRRWTDVDYVGDGVVGHRLDVVLPTVGQEPFPTVVVIYGSAFRSNNWKQIGFETLSEPLLEAGFAVVAINHCSSTDAIWPAQIHDCKAAVRFIRANAADYDLDASAIGVTGYSSGGHLAAMLGTAGSVCHHAVGDVEMDLDGSLGRSVDVSCRVDAVVDWFGPTDFTIMNACGSEMDHDAPDSPESELVGGPIQENPDRCALANPATYVSPDDPPFLIFHGDADPLVPHCQSELLHETLEAGGVPSVFTIVPGGGHGEGLFVRTHFEAMVEFFHRNLVGLNSAIAQAL